MILLKHQILGGTNMTTGNSLPKQIKTIWAFHALGEFIILLAIHLGFVAAYHYWAVPFLYVMILIFGVLLVAVPLIDLALIPYRYRFWRYQISETDVELQSGFVFRKRVSVPIGRVQDVKLVAGPLLQWQKLQKVVIETASTSHDIDGLELEAAENLRAQIIQLAKEARNAQI
ncbi:hypothetical protein FD44_GL000507 [Secundilactobacillus malefermentans DSM 5705 = KCTC 3548]|nr:hypothetical protein FD44_GL000507 [Secundilactobacillus malefermentans DSM 5705 = KCTC 3548]